MDNSITEDYCSFEVSKLLKEKGLCIHNTTGYDVKGNVYLHQGGQEPVCNGQKYYEGRNYIEEEFLCSRPTHSLAIKWIRENFGIYIKIDWFIKEDNSIDWDFSIQKVGPNIDKKGNSEYLKYYDEEIGYNSPEEAIEAALKYVLKTLV